MKKVIKQFRSQISGKLLDFECTRKEPLKNEITGEILISSFWASLTNMENGAPEVVQFICSVPEGYTDLNLETLNTECLTSDKPANKNALIK